jgi:hypothetical protein
VFALEGPMTDDGPWKDAARADRRRVTCGPDRDALAAAYRAEHKLARVPPGTILRPRR